MAKQIKNFNKTQLLLGTLTNFHKKVLTLIETTTAAALHVEGLEPQYAAAVETLSSIVNRPTTYVATQSRQDVDDRRDRFVGVIHQIINAHKTNPIAEKQAAAATLGALMAPYRSIARHQYAKETEEINGMLAVLEAHSEETALLDLTDEVAGLKEAFEAVIDEKIAEEQARQAINDTDSKEAMSAANNLYDQIVQVVNAYAIVSPTDEIEGFIDQLNATVAVYAAMIDSTPSSPTTPGETEEPDGGDDTGEPTDPTEPTDPDGDGDGGGTPGEV